MARGTKDPREAKPAEEIMSEQVLLKQTAFGRWIVANALHPVLAWSGARWVTITPDGLPAGPIQVSNFASREDAEQYAVRFGFKVLKSAEQ